jgi:hypothetical protein
LTAGIALLSRTIHRRVDPRPLAAARIVIGFAAALAALEAWRALPRLLRPEVVRLPVIAPVPHLPSAVVPVFLAIWLAAAVLFALGWRTRAAGGVLVGVTGYLLILDQQIYSNHLYLLFLVLLLLTISGSGAAWSLDARRDAATNAAFWPVLLLRIQASIVYFFSALAKVNPSYLSGAVLGASLKHEGWTALPLAWRAPTFLAVLAAGSVLAELFVAVGLWPRRLRPFALAAGAGFHVFIIAFVDSSRLSLGIFALTMFAMYALFVDGER